MTNYICINGNKTELTEEQLKQLGIEIPKSNPFERQPKRKPFYYITNKGKAELGIELQDFQCNGLYDVGNYCTDKAIMEQRALHETLNRLLWRYSMEHDGDKIDKDFFMVIREKDGLFSSYSTSTAAIGEVKFYSHEDAKAAIKEIVEPFMKAHNDFKF